MAKAKLYDDLIMEHIKHARNYRVLDDANRKANGSNPLCGDDITVYARIENERIADIAFQCACCGISMASASIMTEIVKGRRTGDARTLLRAFIALLEGRAASRPHDLDSLQHALLCAVSDHPARTRCAVMPWATLEAVLDGRQEPVFVR
ncbi:MAG: Fe-S cluster assembly sulfur transfer protein SufU [Burkholderiales bacterium]